MLNCLNPLHTRLRTLGKVSDIISYLSLVSKWFEGLPVGVQVIGSRYRDELVLRVMAELESTVDYALPVYHN